jgi:hypothetical protein
MQQNSRTRNNKLAVLFLLAICFCITSYKDLKKGFVEGYNSYNAAKSIDSMQQSSLNGVDFLSVRLLLLNKIN